MKFDSILNCKKCLIRDLAETEYSQSLESYMQRIPDDIKTSDDIYIKRLSICKQCENLVSGMCLKCGCYVELRAMTKNRSCPCVPAKW